MRPCLVGCRKGPGVVWDRRRVLTGNVGGGRPVFRPGRHRERELTTRGGREEKERREEKGRKGGIKSTDVLRLLVSGGSSCTRNRSTIHLLSRETVLFEIRQLLLPYLSFSSWVRKPDVTMALIHLVPLGRGYLPQWSVRPPLPTGSSPPHSRPSRHRPGRPRCRSPWRPP